MSDEAKTREPINHRPVIVCTDNRGVFFGYVPEDTASESLLGPKPVTLKRARMAVRWTEAERGVLGLASAGPGPGCRISDAATITVAGIRGVLDVSDEATERWESAPWG